MGLLQEKLDYWRQKLITFKREINEKSRRESEIMREEIPNYRGAVKIIRGTPSDHSWWEDHFRQLADPINYRPAHHQRKDVKPGCRYNPLTGQEEFYLQSDAPGAPKNTAYIKKTDMTILFPDRETELYSGSSRHEYYVGVVYRTHFFDPHKEVKYCDTEYMNTNARPWKTPASDAEKAIKNEYWGKTKKRTAQFASLIQEARQGKHKKIVFMGCPSKEAVAAILIVEYTWPAVMAGLHKQYLARQRLEKNLPIILRKKDNKNIPVIYDCCWILDNFMVLMKDPNLSSEAISYITMVDMLPIFLESLCRNEKVSQEHVDHLCDFFSKRKHTEGLIFLSLFKLLENEHILPETKLTTPAIILHSAVHCHSLELLEIILEANCVDMNARDAQNRTALMLAIRQNKMTLVDKMLDAQYRDRLSIQHQCDLAVLLISLADVDRATTFDLSGMSDDPDAFMRLKNALLVAQGFVGAARKNELASLLVMFLEINIRLLMQDESADREVIMSESNSEQSFNLAFFGQRFLLFCDECEIRTRTERLEQQEWRSLSFLGKHLIRH